ncbi:hypothetical protein L249_6889 [Ophiocordyceps polyrhachis-furcata BCC 54312]|uniref:DUF1275 domain protein n=1 Tax=Ophiocordyceps polyrhachis-furcata BCC 54312 TaxID=1330021 RepID=A0A367LL53_9HYPO|nr:hypothetical protein L249_6889 [Ophiocordyceps polyrhachis-furcata BCC 54312]
MLCHLPLRLTKHATTAGEKSSRSSQPVSQVISSDSSAGSSPWPVSPVPERSRLLDKLTDDVRCSFFAESQLVLLTFCTGLQGKEEKKKKNSNEIKARQGLTPENRGGLDVTTFLDYHCFASNQTGNTVFLCIALIISKLDSETFVTANIGMSLGVFLGAGWLTGQLSHEFGPRKRWWLVWCNLLQTAFVFAVAGLQYRYGRVDRGPVALGSIALLAFAAGSQVVQSRSLRMTEISTAMATAAWVDLVIDPKLFALHNRSRNRRVAFLISLAVGSLVGAVVYRQVGSAAVMVVSGAGKLLVTLLYLFSPAENKRQTEMEV